MAAPIVISGGICSGKAQLIRFIDIEGFPVSHYSRDNSPMLKLFQSNMERYAFAHELEMLKQSVIEEQNAHKAPSQIIFLNGSWREDIWCHSRAMRFQSGILDPVDWDILEGIGKSLMVTTPPPLMMIYLSCNPNVLHQRIQKYGSKEERGITLDYLDTLAAYYSDLAEIMRERTWVVRIPVDELNFYEDSGAMNEAIECITRNLKLLKVFAWNEAIRSRFLA